MKKSTAKVIAGVDEAGRGALAGPVVAASVILPADFPRSVLADSKAINAQKRQKLARLVQNSGALWATGWVWPAEIDCINILQATMQAMRQAVLSLAILPAEALIDGNRCPQLPITVRPVIKGDQKIGEIMAASIIAKVARDDWMNDIAAIAPLWAFDRHKGYPTREHYQLCRRYGLSAIHRRTFRHFSC